MSYSVEFTEDVVKQLRKMDRFTRTMILNWISKHLVDTDNPFSSGHALTGDKVGLWRYRIGDYRIISSIDKGKLVILLVEIGHRSNIYDRVTDSESVACRMGIIFS
ncbi:MAG: type II toxin-antitoxin system RelE/ParE family toxin [archaeon]|nr:type II toxin-antitoxin system RelE/ParE family toxin [archaeon]